MEIDTRVICNVPDRWLHGCEGVIVALNVTASDGYKGHLIKLKDCITVLPESQLIRITHPIVEYRRWFKDIVALRDAYSMEGGSLDKELDFRYMWNLIKQLHPDLITSEHTWAYQENWLPGEFRG